MMGPFAISPFVTTIRQPEAAHFLAIPGHGLLLIVSGTAFCFGLAFGLGFRRAFPNAIVATILDFFNAFFALLF